ncbi:MAG TPA: hypothetical protein VGL66_17715 [Caulobacteraceae bacterium]
MALKSIRRKRAAQDQDEEREVIKRLGIEVTAEAVIAAGAFILALTTSLTQVYLAVRGPVISMLPIDSMVLYTDSGVLQAALHVTMTNSASADYGDLVERADLSLKAPSGRWVRFPLDSTAQIHLVDDSQKVVDRCDPTLRCLPFKGMVVVDRNDKLLALPGGATRADYLTFDLWTCRGAAVDCAYFKNFNTTGAALDHRSLNAKVDFVFHRARNQTLTCVTRPVDGARLEKIAWLSFPCVGFQD